MLIFLGYKNLVFNANFSEMFNVLQTMYLNYHHNRAYFRTEFYYLIKTQLKQAFFLGHFRKTNHKNLRVYSDCLFYNIDRKGLVLS